MNIHDLYQQVTDAIVAELEHGAIPWVKNWKGEYALPTNANTTKHYNGINVAILWYEGERRGYEHQLWLTYKQAIELGAQVKQGEKSTHIVYTSTYQKKDEDTQSRFLKAYSVFNISQLDGYDMPPLPPRSEMERHAQAEQVITDTKAAIHHGGDRACYIPSLDIIQMPHAKDFTTMPSYYSTSFHELSHWSGAKPRLDRNLTGRFGDEAYAAEELVAELTAAFLCASLGIHGELRHAGYIAHWIKLLKSDDKAIFTAASKAQQSADFINPAH